VELTAGIRCRVMFLLVGPSFCLHRARRPRGNLHAAPFIVGMNRNILMLAVEEKTASSLANNVGFKMCHSRTSMGRIVRIVSVSGQFFVVVFLSIV